MRKILIIDDEQSILDSMTMVLEADGYSVDSCLNGQTGIQKVLSNDYDLIFLDIKMPRMDGIEVLQKITDYNKNLVVIMISGHGTIENAVEATRLGAYDFLQKPLPDLHELRLLVRNAIEYKRAKDYARESRRQFEEAAIMIGNSESMKGIRELIERFAPMNQNVLITGESGTGKELVARQIHLQSGRSEKPFIVINCANLKVDNADNELFGYFQDDNFIKGKFDSANGGSLFFDEISQLHSDIQAKLLEVIETNRFAKPGTIGEVYLNTRFIFATNTNPEEVVKDNELREDFYHRINVLRIDVPPLRSRLEDIPSLTTFFSEKVSEQANLPARKFSQSAVDKLLSLRWPGNVRELKNLIERLVISIDKSVIDGEDIEIAGTKHLKEFSDLFNKNMSLNDFQNESERIFLLKMLNDYKYNISQTASALQIQRSHLYKLMTKYSIPTPSKIKPA